MKLSREESLSLRQAYRYLEQARGKDLAPAVGERAVTISLKMPGDLARDLQAHAAACRQTTSEVIRRAIAAFLTAAANMAERRHKRGVRLEFAFDRLLAAKLEQIYDMLVPEWRAPCAPAR